jgi:hypothetical protein
MVNCVLFKLGNNINPQNERAGITGINSGETSSLTSGLLTESARILTLLLTSISCQGKETLGTHRHYAKEGTCWLKKPNSDQFHFIGCQYFDFLPTACLISSLDV